MRVPYVSNPPPTNSPEEESIVAAIEARRHPRPLQPLTWHFSIPRQLLLAGTLLLGLFGHKRHSPMTCENSPFAELPSSIKRVKGGVSSNAMKELMTEDRLLFSNIPAGFTEKQWVICVVADEMTKNVHVADETFQQLKSFFNSQEVVGIVATVACYNCVSRFLVALDVGERNGTTPALPETV
ncbi:hypothetical protein FCULG_00004544 [Fusarium culmorum]|uniref:Carboxymuconolactone decarboxylase-like domain-containing protein n=1 Tax=Fusarium culmorum TaxID=5516 RepID=A0A2T4H6N9_FUSCU|nr:hypothetical protein FCULG_00004544 [Fusarium culmorum]